MSTSLTIDTSRLSRLSLGLSRDGETIASLETPASRNHAQLLLPAIREMLKKHSLIPEDLDRIIVHAGPGSFTGLRVGIAVAHALGYALNIPVNGKRMPKGAVEVTYE